MFWHLIITPLVTLFNALFSALPVWTLRLGNGTSDGASDGTSSDNSMVHYALGSLSGLDKWIPIHDGVLPLFAIVMAIFVGLSAFKLLKFVLSLVPTISAGG